MNWISPAVLLGEALGVVDSFEVRSSRVGRFTAVAMLLVRQGGMTRFVWLKQHLHDPTHARKEFRFLRSATQVLRDFADSGVVEPLASCERRGVLITQHAEGSQLHGKSDRDAAARCEQAGLWLGRWHSATAIDAPDDLSRVLMEAERLLAGDQAAPILEMLRHCLSQSSNERRPSVWAHGDFGPHNILHDGDRVTVFDPSFPADLDARDNQVSPFEDLGRYLACLAWLPETRERARSFLNGYNSAAVRPVRCDSMALLLLTARHRLANALAWRSRATPRALVLWQFETWLRTEIVRLGGGAPRARTRRAFTFLTGDQIDGPLQLFVATHPEQVAVLDAEDERLFALDAPLPLPRSSEGEVLLLGSNWARRAATRGVDVAAEVVPLLRQRFDRVIGIDQEASFALGFDDAVIEALDVTLKSNGILRTRECDRLHLSLPPFATETLSSRELLRTIRRASAARKVAQRALDEILARTVAPIAPRRPPLITAHFLGTLTHAGRARELEAIRAHGLRVRGGITGVPRALVEEDRQAIRVLDTEERRRRFRSLYEQGLTAEPRTRLRYHRDMLECKAVLALRGHGELSYRMAEGWAMRRVVVCPDLSQVRTMFPFEHGRNVVYYRDGELPAILEDIECNFGRYTQIAEQGHADWLAWSARSEEWIAQAFSPATVR